jgi:hypothetical protein
MGVDEFATYVRYVTILCVIMAIVNLARFRSRGPRAFVMCGAFLVFGISLNLLNAGSPEPWFALSGAALFVLLVADVVIKMAKPRNPVQ